MSLRRVYGAGPLQLLATLASLLLAAYAFMKIFDGGAAQNVVLWFIGAVLLHDAIAFWLYTALDRVARGRRVAAGINYVRVPAVLSGVFLLVYFPLILGFGRYERATTLSADVYLSRWLAISGAMFALSAALYVLRARRRG